MLKPLLANFNIHLDRIKIIMKTNVVVLNTNNYNELKYLLHLMI